MFSDWLVEGVVRTERRMLTRHRTGPLCFAAWRAGCCVRSCGAFSLMHDVTYITYHTPVVSSRATTAQSFRRALPCHTILGGTLRPERVQQQRCSSTQPEPYSPVKTCSTKVSLSLTSTANLSQAAHASTAVAGRGDTYIPPAKKQM